MYLFTTRYKLIKIFFLFIYFSFFFLSNKSICRATIFLYFVFYNILAIISCLFAVEHLLCIMLYVCLPIVIMITMHLYVYNINFSWSFASFFPPFSLLVFYSFILQVFATIFSFFSFLAVLYPRPTPIENKTIMKANERTKKRKRRMAEKKKSISKDT